MSLMQGQKEVISTEIFHEYVQHSNENSSYKMNYFVNQGLAIFPSNYNT